MKSLKLIASKWFASYIHHKNQRWINHPLQAQQKVFKTLIQQAKNTAFGKDHHFDDIRSYEDFAKRVPIRDYEQFRPYIERIFQGEKNVLWKGTPLYFAKTSGTTSGSKYIPISKQSIKYQIQAARDAILNYIYKSKSANFVAGKMIFLQGSPILEKKNNIPTGRLSGIVAHFVPSYLQSNRMPTWKTNCIDDWETKVNAIVDETLQEDMTLISGIPSWVQMYFEKLVEKTHKPVSEIFKNFQLFIYGGVYFEPYRNRLEYLIGRNIDSIEVFPASEGFFAYQDTLNDKGLLLLVNSGIFYEFIEADKFYDKNPERLTLDKVKTGVNYVMIISTNAGLWGYNIGDTVQFVSVHPFRIIVTGRIKHYISAFGEHVISKEVEEAIALASQHHSIQIREFTVAPVVSPESENLPYHQWVIEFENIPNNIDLFAKEIDEHLQKQNSYYSDLRKGNVLQCLKITTVEKHTFSSYMKACGKLGGQNKIQRLSNDRAFADELLTFSKKYSSH